MDTRAETVVAAASGPPGRGRIGLPPMPPSLLADAQGRTRHAALATPPGTYRRYG